MLIKVNGATIPLNGKKVVVKIIRNSWLCRLLHRDRIVVGKTVHFLAHRLRYRQIHDGLRELQKLHEIGYIRYYLRN